ncbi:uncharacterized protein LOC110209847 isoform X1 [Phascolarctos cinereus]|uniref:Uncharacterized protein LOC110209847 isoform X1 n=1 Tax=Phascolarctos cinereus TaxID=38626 RepID=A0A6P5KHZ2_PHACI|nr:uncharacterized protein LOC110209847 isoform X1 [Phascolarctos cinereus]XP_020844234.1 uncharacterized protein LOC110209847 isoform X1 [Phascolarctos cinereus]
MAPSLLQKQKGRPQTRNSESFRPWMPQWTKKHAPDPWSKCEVMLVMGSLVFLLYIWQYHDNFHFQVVHLYAHLGYPNAQHILGQRYLKGAGVVKNEEMAMHWFRQASQQGHPRSSFNLAVGKLKNRTLAIEEGEVEMLLGVAAGQGLPEAQELLEKLIQGRNKLSPAESPGSSHRP